jgi:hypothetical protein
MIEKLKKLILKKVFHIDVTDLGTVVQYKKITDKQISSELIEVIKIQQDFIDKNINERVVYVDPATGYTNEHKLDKEDTTDKEEDEFVDITEEDMTPEQLAEFMEGGKEEGNKK